MKRILGKLVLAIGLVVLLGGAVLPARAMEPVPMPQTPPLPPTPAPADESKPLEVAGITSPQRLSLSGLKAVLVVGPIDGDNGSWTLSEKEHMEWAATELEANGVAVYRFYTPNNNWDQIKAAAQDAQFFLYRGHGVYWPPPDMPSPPVGGLALKNRIVSSDEIRSGLHLAPGAIVMLYACFAAGTSSIDTTSISSAEAQRRVAQYSDPFLDLGASAYFSNWFGNAFEMFVHYLFEGMTAAQAYEAYFDFSADTTERFAHPNHPDRAMWLDKNYWSSMWKYSNAFAGQPDVTLASLFDSKAMVVDPGRMTYLTRPGGASKSFNLNVISTSSDTFDWTVTIEPSAPDWLELQSTLGGQSGQSVDVVLNPADLSEGIYTANVHVVTGDPSVQNGDQTVEVKLTVTDEIHQVFLPMVAR